jgi:hypothetical protein|tara:strand:- start:702 stop:1406 length:705 start_codon:yes stop_codon:yes gene_type:complete
MTSVTVTSTPFEVTVNDSGTSVTVAATGPAGIGVPAGGSSGQVLAKASGTNYDTTWATNGTGDLLASNNLSDLANAGTARTNLGLGTAATAATGISNTNVPVFTSGVADDDFLRVDGTNIEGRSASEVRSDLGITNVGSYTGQIETVADKTYTIDPGAATARTITGFYIKSGSGTVTATLKNGTDTVKAASVSTSSGDQTSLANTSVSVNGVISIVTSSNSSATDVIFAVEYTE